MYENIWGSVLEHLQGSAQYVKRVRPSMQVLCYCAMYKLEMEAFNCCMALCIYLYSQDFLKIAFIFVIDMEE